ncbi:PREDICTED: protein KRI1 homolog [Camelina sativa]|uniref:Protein KRI1 homolog n=1 Tax=Camelina sativa TaxID=90675 RepID=A0ABM0W7G7_CAMSA|nr:PREDICTED: protein KRI1 homolog [Camelina sativa]
MMRPPIPKAIPDDDDGDCSQIKGFEVDDEYGKRLLHNKNREDLQRLEEMKKRGLIVDEEDEEDNEPESEPDDDLDNPESDLRFVDVLLKVKNKDPSIMDKNAKFYESDEKEKKKKKKKEKKKKKMYLKDVQAQHLLEEGPEFVEEDEEREKVTTYAERQRELRKAVTDALETGEDESDDDDDLFRVVEKEGDDDVEVNEELAKKMDEYFGEKAEDFENQFLKDYLVKQLWKEKEEIVVDEAELDKLDEDEEAVWDQEDYENHYRHQENAGEIIISQSRVVDGSVRKKDSARKSQRKNKEERMKMAEIERKEELKRLKNVKKKEMKEKMKKVLSVAGFKDGEECPLNAKAFDDEFDPEEYDKVMKAAFDDDYYGAEDSDLNSDEDDDGEKPDFDKEDDLLGLPKDWDVIQGGDGFVAAREKVLKQKEKVIDDDEEEEVEVEEEEEVAEEKEADGKRKRKQNTSLVQRAKEALMEEYYKLDYEDTIGDLKTRFKYAKVQPNSYQLGTEEILTLDDTDLNQYVPLKKMAPYVEKDWEVNKHKVKEQKLKIQQLWEGKHNEKRSSKKRKKNEVAETKQTAETKPTQKVDEEGEAETKLSRKAKRRRLKAEKKLPPNRMVAYGKE